MDFIVKKHLSSNYYIDTSQIGNDGIYSKFDLREFKPPIYGACLLDKLEPLFSMDRGEIKEIIDDWASSIKPEIDLKFYWEQLCLSPNHAGYIYAPYIPLINHEVIIDGRTDYSDNSIDHGFYSTITIEGSYVVGRDI